MKRAFLLIGGNLGDREMNLSAARAAIAETCGRIVQQSALYETAAWGLTDQPPFLNQAIELETTLQARQLMRRILKIEKQLGRTRDKRYGPRLIDIDILLVDQEVHDYALLKLPHPELANRRFALLPLAEIAPELEHPVLHQSIAHLLKVCPDQLAVTKVSN